jgi:hypothetical protein
MYEKVFVNSLPVFFLSRFHSRFLFTAFSSAFQGARITQRLPVSDGRFEISCCRFPWRGGGAEMLGEPPVS